jgi:polyhydroxyalkanoate synthesis repressor PhaR
LHQQHVFFAFAQHSSRILEPMAKNDTAATHPRKIKIRRYPNRRYYNATHSQHATLEAIYELICAGHDIEVSDSKTGEDITAKVLTQIILEHEAPKLDAFPVGLLHHLIRTNEPLVREFIEKYFSKAFSAFVESHKQLSDYWRESMGLGGTPTATWPQAMWEPLAEALSGAGGGKTETTNGAATRQNRHDPELRETVQQLQEQVRQLREELNGR